MDALGHGLGTGGHHRVQPVGEHRTEDGHHLPVAIRNALQFAAHPLQGWRQFSILERRAIAQGAGFAIEDWHIVPLPGLLTRASSKAEPSPPGSAGS